jgi:hypothetical protein
MHPHPICLTLENLDLVVIEIASNFPLVSTERSVLQLLTHDQRINLKFIPAYPKKFRIEAISMSLYRWITTILVIQHG